MSKQLLQNTDRMQALMKKTTSIETKQSQANILKMVDALGKLKDKACIALEGKDYITLTIDVEQIRSSLTNLMHNMMIAYFSLRLSSLNNFKDWIYDHVHQDLGWNLSHSKYLG